jgi:hypothetical protein
VSRSQCKQLVMEWMKQVAELEMRVVREVGVRTPEAEF